MDFDSTALRVDGAPQYFFDNAVVEEVQNLQRVVHRPQKVPGPLISADRPWEHVTYFSSSMWNVNFDPISDLFKCWYEDWEFFPRIYAQDASSQFELAGRGRGGFHSPPHHMRMLYAYSKDGSNWTKPEFDYLEEEGRKTNVILGDRKTGSIHAASIIDDIDDQAHRYKMLYYNHAPDSSTRIMAAWSGDGLNWTTADRPAIFGHLGSNLGDVMVLSRDPDSRVYRLYCRHPDMCRVPLCSFRPRVPGFSRPSFPDSPWRENMRRIFLAESADLVHWSSPVPIHGPDANDNLDESFYSLASIKLGNVYLGFLTVFQMVENTLDVRLMVSRNGWKWSYLDRGNAWLTTTPGGWDSFMVNMPSIPIDHNDETLVYYGGSAVHHDYWIMGLREGLTTKEAHNHKNVRYGLGLARMRKHGYVSLFAGPVRAGLLHTRPLKTDGTELWISAACEQGGEIKVEVADESDVVIPGYDQLSADPFSGNSLAHRITWQGKAIIEHAGTVRLRFYAKDAHLYSFVFSSPK